MSIRAPFQLIERACWGLTRHIAADWGVELIELHACWATGWSQAQIAPRIERRMPRVSGGAFLRHLREIALDFVDDAAPVAFEVHWLG